MARKLTEEEKATKRLLASPAYKIAYRDSEFMDLDTARPIRLQAELMKPEYLLRQEKIASTIVVFGGTRIPEPEKAKQLVKEAEAALKKDPKNETLKRDLAIARRLEAKSHYYDKAYEFGRLVSSENLLYDDKQYVIVTGGGPGIMEAANRGAFEAGAKSIGLNITLPMEQAPNAYISPELCFQFHYFAIRKMHFLLRAKALVAFPGGYGTLDEVFEALTLVQTQSVRRLPIVLFGEEFWRKLINFDLMVEEGTIDPEDLDLFIYADEPLDAWNHVKRFYQNKANSRQ
ncbi:TIGR00730 family Rossman fold protein [candidate division GN15 bacterium]|nr:TIGR00730 family Rossman fold protein [candidate division GN15 bacterium]